MVDGTHMCFSLLCRDGVSVGGVLSIFLSGLIVEVEVDGTGSSTYSRTVSDSASSTWELLVGSNGAYIITPPSSSSTAPGGGVSESFKPTVDLRLARIFHMLPVCGAFIPFGLLFLSFVGWPFMTSSEASIRTRS